MDHLAIMRKSWGLIDKIISGQKKIESRWYLMKCRPWDEIRAGDTVYFKDSGEAVRAKAEVGRVMQFSDLTPLHVKSILDEYGYDDGLEKEEVPEFFRRFRDKKYCLLIFLKDAQAIAPFSIDKRGFGTMSAWITLDDISRIKKISMKTLKFKSHLIQPILAREKTVTWRLFDDKDLRAGDCLELINSETGEKFGEAEIVGCQERRIEDLTDNDLKENYYRDKVHVMEINRELYGDKVSLKTPVKIIRFSLR